MPLSGSVKQPMGAKRDRAALLDFLRCPPTHEHPRREGAATLIPSKQGRSKKTEQPLPHGQQERKLVSSEHFLHTRVLVPRFPRKRLRIERKLSGNLGLSGKPSYTAFLILHAQGPFSGSSNCCIVPSVYQHSPGS